MNRIFFLICFFSAFFANHSNAGLPIVINNVDGSLFGLQGNQGSDISDQAVSEDGRFLVFRSASDNLVANDNNRVSDVFLLDRQANTLLKISADHGGINYRDAVPYPPIISGNGQKIFYPYRGSGVLYLRVYDRLTATQTALVSNSEQALPDKVFYPNASFDGKIFTFQSGGSSHSEVGYVDTTTQVLKYVNLDSLQSTPGIMRFNPRLNRDGTAIYFIQGNETVSPRTYQSYKYSIATQTTSVAAKKSNGEPLPRTFEILGSNDGSKLLLKTHLANFDPTDTRFYNVIGTQSTLTNSLAGITGNPADTLNSSGYNSHFKFSPDDNYAFFDTNDYLIPSITHHAIYRKNFTTGTISAVPTRVYYSGPDYDAGFSISHNAERVYLRSPSNTLIDGDTNRMWDIFEYRFSPNRFTRLSTSKTGPHPATISGFRPVISGNARFIAFETLDPIFGLENAQRSNIVVRDLVNNSLTAIPFGADNSPNYARHELNNATKDGRYFSADSETISFGSIVINPPPPEPLCHVVDKEAKIIGRLEKNVSAIIKNANGNSLVSGSENAQISSDGYFVSFSSGSLDVPTSDSLNCKSQVFLMFRNDTTARLISQKNGVPGNAGSYQAKFSEDGRFLVFLSRASNLDVIDNNDFYDVYVFDRYTNQLELVSYGVGNTPSNGNSFGGASISKDGRYVAFFSSATNLGASFTGPNNYLYVRDRQTGQLQHSSVAPPYATTSFASDNRTVFLSPLDSSLRFFYPQENFPSNSDPYLIAIDIFDGRVMTPSDLNPFETHQSQLSPGGAYYASYASDGCRVVYESSQIQIPTQSGLERTGSNIFFRDWCTVKSDGFE